jgi:aromatic-L-amino-acid/L-tryptophan decarboxylase
MRTLALDNRERAAADRLLAEFLDGYERAIPAPRIVPEVDREALSALLDTPFPEQGVGVERLFAEIESTVLPNSTAIAHPRFLAYVQGPPNGIAPYAEAIAAALNQNCSIWQLSPAASVIERSVVGWLGGLFELPDEAGGLITDGGSMANLIGLAAALADRRPDFRRAGLQSGGAPLIAYTSEQAHDCIDKAVALLGLGLDHLRRLPTDDGFQLDVEALRAAIAADRAAGREPFCVIATAGTTMTGAIDQLDAIADVCAEEGLWLHVDGAFGALFVLSQRLRARLAPCGRADSLALDPHKLLFAPLEAGCVLVRDRAALRRAFAVHSSYLSVAEDPLMLDYTDYGPQLSRAFKAFKVWCALRAFGTGPFRAAIDRTLDLARRLGERIDADPSLELMTPVTTTAVCLRIPGVDHRTALATLAADGTALLGPARVRGRFGIRACVTNYRTTPADIDLVADRLSELGAVSQLRGRRSGSGALTASVMGGGPGRFADRTTETRDGKEQ